MGSKGSTYELNPSTSTRNITSILKCTENLLEIKILTERFLEIAERERKTIVNHVFKHGSTGFICLCW